MYPDSSDRPRPGAFAGESGQAAVSLVACLPLILAVVLVCVQVALSGFGLWAAGTAARAGARAALVGGDVDAAVVGALPGYFQDGSTSAMTPSGRVRVDIRIPSVLPGLPRPRVGAESGLGADGQGGSR